MNTKLSYILPATFLIYSAFVAQAKFIVADEITRLPISNVSIYTESFGKINGTYSNEYGESEPSFAYKYLSFSHINYVSQNANTAEIGDTVFMKPKTLLLSEVLVSNRTQSWYRNILKRVEKNKKNIYRKQAQPLNYKYTASTLGDSSLYKFVSNGSMLIMPLKEEKNYKIAQLEGTIICADLNAKGDFTQLGRTVYNEILNNFNSEFIKNSSFSLNSAYENGDKNVIMINYTSTKKFKRDGYLIVDTLNNILNEITQHCDTKYNLPAHTSAIFRSFASKLGMKCLKWETIIRTKFDKLGNSYQMSECDFQISRIDEHKQRGEIKSYFTNIQSCIVFESNSQSRPSWVLLPREPYMGVLSKQDRIAMETLQKLKVIHNKTEQNH